MLFMILCTRVVVLFKRRLFLTTSSLNYFKNWNVNLTEIRAKREKNEK